MTQKPEKLILFAGSSIPELGGAIASNLEIKLGEVDLTRFSNGEIHVRYVDNVRGTHAFVLQTLSPPVNDNLMELLIMIDALKRASAAKISAVIPHYGYARQDRKATGREPITAKLVADLLTIAGIDRLLTMDLHAGQIQGFFNVPVDHLTAVPILSSYFVSKGLENLVVVSPDVGRVNVAKKYADTLGANLAILHKSRPGPNESEVTHVVGKVKDKTALLIDDMIDTAGTLVTSAEALRARGTKGVYTAATHALLSGPAVERLAASPIKEVVVTDTVPVPPDKKLPKLTILPIAELLAEAINIVFEHKSISALFSGQNQG